MKRLLILFLIFFGILVNFSYALTVGPAKIEFTVDPEQTLNFNLFIRNDSDFDTNYYLSVEGFTEVSGEKKFFENPPEKSWFEIQKSVFLKAKEDIQIPVKINVPRNAPPGGHFLAIWVGTGAPQKEAGQIGIVSRVGALVFINVRGDTLYRASIEKFEFKKIVYNFPVKFSYIIKNQGNTYLKPDGYIEIKNIFGKRVASLPVNPKELQILPNTEKTLETEWQGKSAFGIYRVLLTMNYGENNKINLSSWLIFLYSKYLIITIILVIFIVFIVPKLIQRYNEYIIKKYSQTKNE